MAVLVAFVCVSVFGIGATAQGATESLVTVGSPQTPFPQNKQNEPGLAINPTSTSPSTAATLGPSRPMIGFSARDGTPGPGPIGTLPNFTNNDLVSDGDPVLAWGPRPNANGNFSYTNGARLYHSSLAANFPGAGAFKGFEAITVSHTDNPQGAADGNEQAWSDPAIVTQSKQSSTTFSDKEAVWADNAASSPKFRKRLRLLHALPLQRQRAGADLLHAVDGRRRQLVDAFHLSPAYNSTARPGRQGCAVRTDSEGTVHVTWEDTVKHQSVVRMVHSTDGGRTFGTARVIASITDVGRVRQRALDLVRRHRRRADQLVPEPRHRQRGAQRSERARHPGGRVV
jgi:hypothetical protein